MGAAPSTACPQQLGGTQTITTVISVTNFYPEPATITQYTYTGSTSTFYTDTTSTSGTGYVTTPTDAQVETVTVLTKAPAETTITIPTSAGFTPVTCLSTYQNVYVTATFTSTITLYPSTVISTATVSANGVTTSYTQTFYTSTALVITGHPTVTTTVTLSNPTSTVYDACASNNVVANYPGEGFLSGAQPINGVQLEWPQAVDAVDCCALCQANDACVGSVYVLDGAGNSCRLGITTNTCDPDFNGLMAYGFPSFPGPSAYISNSGCGQFEIVNILSIEF